MLIKLPQNERMTVSQSQHLVISQPAAAAWDDFVRAQPNGGHLLQLSRWGQLKSRFGWDARIIALSNEQGIQAGALALLQRLPAGAGLLAYVPLGAYAADPSHYPQLWQAIRQETGAAFLKIEPGHGSAITETDLAQAGFRPSPQTIQPPTTIIIDINGDDSDIMQRMNQGTRRKIRKSRSGPVVYREGDRSDLPRFNCLMQQTGQRNAFGVHSAGYFEAVYDLFMPGDGALLLARHEDELLAAIMVFALGDTAWYLYGASARSQGNLYATYGIQWAAIKWAQQRGCRFYDLWGVPDYDEAALEAGFKSRKDGLWGVYGFKRGWGGQVTRTLGTWDLAWNPLVYAAYRAALKLRR